MNTLFEKYPGRKLDILIAEKVFDYKVENKNYSISYEYGDVEHFRLEMLVGNEWVNLPEYSTRIEDAWKVVEHLKHLFISVEYNANHSFWACSISGNCLSTDRSSEKAICLAALEALGYNEE